MSLSFYWSTVNDSNPKET